MGFRYDSNRPRKKDTVQKAGALDMITVIIILGISIWFGWWLPSHFNVRAYLPIPANWPDLAISVAGGVVAFILLQFVSVLISGILFPLQPQDQYEEEARKAVDEYARSRAARRSLRWYEMIWSAVPLILIVIGGAIGGALGAVALFINMGIFGSKADPFVKFALTGFVTVVAIALYFVLVGYLIPMFR